MKFDALSSESVAQIWRIFLMPFPKEGYKCMNQLAEINCKIFFE